MAWTWSRQPKSSEPSYLRAICPECGDVVRREGALLHVLWWFLFGLGDCPTCEAVCPKAGEHCVHWREGDGKCCACGDDPGDCAQDTRTASTIEVGRGEHKDWT